MKNQRSTSRYIKSILGATALLGLCVGTLYGQSQASSANRHAAEWSAKRTDDKAIRPFQIHVPQAELDDLRRRCVSTRMRHGAGKFREYFPPKVAD